MADAVTKRWAVGISAVRPGETRHCVAIVLASSRDDAIGKGYRLALECYPPGNRWVRSIVLRDCDDVTDPDGPVVLTPA